MKKSKVIFSLALAVLFSLVLSNVAFGQDQIYEKAKEAYNKKDWPNLIKYSKQLTDEYPEWFVAHYLLTTGYIRSGQNDNAIRSANRALEAAENNDQSFQCRYYLAEAYYKKGDFKNAISVIDRIVQRYQNVKGYARASTEIAKMAGYSNFSLGNYKQAIAAFQPLMSSGKASADVLRAVAKCHQESGDNKKSIEIISQVVRKDPKDINAHKILIKSYLNDKQFSKSIQAANTALTNFDRDAEVHYLKGAAHQGAKQYKQAEAELRRSLTLKNDDKTRRHLAQVLLAEEKYREAADEFGRAQGSFSNDANLYYKLAFAWASYVPKDAEKYKGKQPEERNYFLALENARAAIKRATELGIGQAEVAALNGVIDNKWERLDKGAVIEVEVEVTIDPETGEVTRKEKVKGEK